MFARSLGIPTAWRVMRNLRFQSTSVDQSVDPVLVDVNQKNGIATVTMNQKPVNNMTLNFLRSFCDKMDLLEKEKVKGMILTSVSDDRHVASILQFSTSSRCKMFSHLDSISKNCTSLMKRELRTIGPRFKILGSNSTGRHSQQLQ